MFYVFILLSANEGVPTDGVGGEGIANGTPHCSLRGMQPEETQSFLTRVRRFLL
jgi:hypothetical protein